MGLIPNGSSYDLNEVGGVVRQAKNDNVIDSLKGVSFNDTIRTDDDLEIRSICVALAVKKLIRREIGTTLLSRDPEELVGCECVSIGSAVVVILKTVLASEAESSSRWYFVMLDYPILLQHVAYEISAVGLDAVKVNKALPLRVNNDVKRLGVFRRVFTNVLELKE